MHHLRFQIRRTAADRQHHPRHVPAQSPRCGLYVRPQRQGYNPQGLHEHRGFPFGSTHRAVHPAGQRGLPLPNQHTGGRKRRHDASVPAFKSAEDDAGTRPDLPLRHRTQWGHSPDLRSGQQALQRHSHFHYRLPLQNHPPKDRPQG